MTTYLFGSLFTDNPIKKEFETDIEAFEYAHGMTDGPDRVPICKYVDGKRYTWYQQGWYDGEWVCDRGDIFP
jgi:hypothetical protein